MLPFVIIRQDALAKWYGKIDATDALLVSLLRSLNPDNPKVSAAMWEGHFLFCRSYILEMLPLLSITEDRISRRLKKLSEIGLVDLRRKLTGRGKLLYAKLSRLYWHEEDRVNKKANSHTVKTPYGENAIRCSVRNQDGFAPHDHIYDHEEESADSQAADEPFGSPPENGLGPKRDSLGIVPTEKVQVFPDPEEEPLPAPERVKLLHQINEQLRQRDKEIQAKLQAAG